jgi:hypothetical protein
VDTSSPPVTPDGPPAAVTPDASGTTSPDAAVVPPPADSGAPVTAPDGGAPADAAPAVDAAEPPLPPPLAACTTASIDRLTQWLNWGQAAEGTILVKEGDAYVGRGQLMGAWDQIVVYLQNAMDKSVDLTNSKGFWLTYSATADFYAQLRPVPPNYNGPKKHVIKLPSTGGMILTRFFPFEASAWTTIHALGEPTYPLSDALKAAVSFDFTSPTDDTVVFKGLRIDGVVPPCN